MPDRKPFRFTGTAGCAIIRMHRGHGAYYQRYGEETRMNGQKTWTIAGCVLWIGGLTAFIAGLNLTGSTKEWMTVAGSIAFLIGLGITGAVWLKRKKEEQE